MHDGMRETHGALEQAAGVWGGQGVSQRVLCPIGRGRIAEGRCKVELTQNQYKHSYIGEYLRHLREG